MADKQFERVILNSRERPLSTDMNRQFSQTARSLQELAQRRYAKQGASPAGIANYGFVGDGLRVIATGGATVGITSGIGYLNGAPVTSLDAIVGLDDKSSYKPVIVSTAQVITPVPNLAVAANERYDIVVVRPRFARQDPDNRDILDPATGIFSAANVNKTASPVLDDTWNINSAAGYINYITGVEAAVGAAAKQATPGGWTKIADVYIAPCGGGVPVIGWTNLIDSRWTLSEYSQLHIRGTALVDVGAGTHSIVRLSAPPGIQVAPYGVPAAPVIYIVGGLGDGTILSTQPITAHMWLLTEGGGWTTDMWQLSPVVATNYLSLVESTQLATSTPPIYAHGTAVGILGAPDIVVSMRVLHQYGNAVTVSDNTFPVDGWTYNFDITIGG